MEQEQEEQQQEEEEQEQVQEEQAEALEHGMEVEEQDGNTEDGVASAPVCNGSAVADWSIYRRCCFFLSDSSYGYIIYIYFRTKCEGVGRPLLTLSSFTPSPPLVDPSTRMGRRGGTPVAGARTLALSLKAGNFIYLYILLLTVMPG